MVQTQQPAALVDDHAHRVEADRAGARALVALVAQPRTREPSQACALARTQPRQRLLIGANRSPAESRAASLDLDEHERLAIEHDQVDLAVAGARVARQRREAKAREVGRRKVLSEAPREAPRIGAALGMLCIVPELRTATTNTDIVSFPSFNGPASPDSIVPANCGACVRGAKIEKQVNATAKIPADAKASRLRPSNHFW